MAFPRVFPLYRTCERLSYCKGTAVSMLSKLYLLGMETIIRSSSGRKTVSEWLATPQQWYYYSDFWQDQYVTSRPTRHYPLLRHQYSADRVRSTPHVAASTSCTQYSCQQLTIAPALSPSPWVVLPKAIKAIPYFRGPQSQPSASKRTPATIACSASRSAYPT